jgi:SAM-dependent methyltransferase
MPSKKITKILIAGDFLSPDDVSRFETIKTTTQYTIDLLHYSRNLEKKNIQKLACRITVDQGYDYVILIHKKELLEKENFFDSIYDEISKKELDVLIGNPDNRNKEQSFFNALIHKIVIGVKKRTIPFHSCFYPNEFSVFSLKLLKSVPFELNANGFLFALELYLQSIHIKAKIGIQLLPTEQVLLSFKRQRQIIFTLLHYKLHEIGMFCLLKYQNIQPLLYRDKTFIEYSSHQVAIKKVKELKPKTLLDIGCGPGFVGRKCEENGIRVTGIDQNQPLDGMLSHFYTANIDSNQLPVDLNQFDLIMMLDIIEHLSNPEEFLLMMRNSLTFEGNHFPRLLLSTPNVAFITMRINLLLGRFNYAERGILDITHKRLFTKSSLYTSLVDCGYKVDEMIPIGVPFGTVLPGKFGKFLGAIADFFARLYPNLFAFQIMLLCSPTPGLKQILLQANIKSQKTKIKKIKS